VVGLLLAGSLAAGWVVAATLPVSAVSSGAAQAATATTA
jgi:hypothetical protein